MTDGIIQQIFNKYLIGGEFKNDYVITNRKLELIQQELIAKIKQESYHIEMHGIGYDSIQLIKLIGDNKE